MARRKNEKNIKYDILVIDIFKSNDKEVVVKDLFKES